MLRKKLRPINSYFIFSTRHHNKPLQRNEAQQDHSVPARSNFPLSLFVCHWLGTTTINISSFWFAGSALETAPLFSF